MKILEAVNVTYTYGAGTPFETKALDNVSLSIEKGEFVGIIGHTGSGKSTLIQHFNALLEPQKGRILFNGNDINKSKDTQRDVRFKVGLCFQYPEYQLFEDTVYKDISFGPKNMGKSNDEIDRMVRSAARYAGVKDELLNKSPFDLSGGEKRRVAIAGVMAMEPEVLIMDEPAAGLDPRGKRNIFSLISNYRKKTGSTVIIVSHSMEDVAAYAERVVVIDHGKVAMDGDVDSVFSQADKLLSLGLNIPQMTYIVSGLIKKGYQLNPAVYTIEKAEEVLFSYFKEKGEKKC